MSDLYCVFGNPIAHSKSPVIHATFAAETGQDISYEARLAAVDGFKQAISEFVAAGGKGANVTVPFKEEAFRLATQLSERATRAGAVNTLVFSGAEIHGDNTDGAGLVRDIVHNLGVSLAGKAEALAASFADMATVNAGNFAKTEDMTFDLVINATSASLSGDALPLPNGIFAEGSVAYDMMYGQSETPFLAQAREQGVVQRADGLGMLVEQAAEAFFVWRGVRPATRRVLADLRSKLAQ